MDTVINGRLGRDYMTAFRNRDAAWWDAHIAPEFVRHDPGLPFTVRGPVGMRRLAELMHGAFSEVELPITHVVAQDDRVLVHLRMRGWHNGDFNGMPATGNRIDVAVMDLFRIGNGKLVEHWALMDNLTMLRQIGVVNA